MKKNSTGRKDSKPEQKSWKSPLTIGLDVGDRTSRYCIPDRDGEIVQEGSVNSTNAGVRPTFGQIKKCRIAGSGHPFALAEPDVEDAGA